MNVVRVTFWVVFWVKLATTASVITQNQLSFHALLSSKSTKITGRKFQMP